MVDNYRYIDRYIYDEFIKQRGFSIVAFYDISRGLSFLDPAMEREFNKITANEAIGLKRVLPSKIFPYIDIALKEHKNVPVYRACRENNSCGRYGFHVTGGKNGAYLALRVVK